MDNVTIGMWLLIHLNNDSKSSKSSAFFAGYGDITPFTNLEVGISLIFELIGVFYFGYIIRYVTCLLFTAKLIYYSGW